MDAERIGRLDTELALLAITVSRARPHLQIGDWRFVKLDLGEIESEARMQNITLPGEYRH